MKSMFAAAVAAVFVAGAANAATTSYSDSISMTSLDFDTTLSVAKFDSALGTLNSVTVELTGVVDGGAEYENRSTSSGTTFKLSVAALIEAAFSFGGSVEVNVSPTGLSSPITVGVFDGTLDFAGTSGGSVSGLTDTDTDSKIYTTGLSNFIGAGNLDIFINADGTSQAIGGANVATIFTTDASASVKVTYDYSPIPLPAALPLLGAGIGALAIARRRAA
ncbi:MAG: choice-of-anchor E domain-containing protein [Mangrovicoccus sp.]